MAVERGNKSRKLNHLHRLKILSIPKRFSPYRCGHASVYEDEEGAGCSMRRVKTHFEQVPVETVKKIADKDEEELEPEITIPNLVVETPATKTEPYSVNSFMYCRNRA